jgi:hypothetical protein
MTQISSWFRRFESAIVVCATASALLGAFVLSCSLALGRPVPHHIPLGVIGAAGDAGVLADLQRATADGLQITRYPSLDAARQAIDEQRNYGVVMLGRPARLYVSSASGASVAQVLRSAAEGSAGSQVIRVQDLHPLPRQDPNGLISFYVVLAATILGFATIFQLRANAPGMSMRAWLGCIAALSCGGGLLLAVITDPLLGALHTSFWELWGVLAAEVGVAATFNALMLSLIGRWAILPTWILFVVLGNTASGGAVAPPLLPAFYRSVGRVIPTGATIKILRTAVSFPHAQHLAPVLVLLGWLAGGLALLIGVHRWRGLTPTA